MRGGRPAHGLLLVVLVCSCAYTHGLRFDPCEDPVPVARNGNISIGVAYWPGGLESDWGDPTTGLHPCDPEARANLTAAGASFAVFNVRVDRLTVMKTSFPEELILTTKALSNTSAVVTAVAFRGKVRSDARYIMSLAPEVTKGTGFVGSLALIAKFETGLLKYLQFYNLTCNDCGGTSSPNCLNRTSCALAVSACTCPITESTTAAANTSSPSPSPAASVRHLLQDAAPGAAVPAVAPTDAAPNGVPPAAVAAAAPPDPAAAAAVNASSPPVDAATPPAAPPADNSTATPPAPDASAALAAGNGTAVTADNSSSSTAVDAAAAGTPPPATSADAPPTPPPGNSSNPLPVEVLDPTQAGAGDSSKAAASPSNSSNTTNSSTPLLGVSASSNSSTCSYANLTFCATGIHMAFEGVDMNGRAFTTAASVRKLNSYSLLSLYNLGKDKFLDVKSLFSDTSQSYWGKFGAVQQDIQAAYSGNAQAGRTTGALDNGLG